MSTNTLPATITVGGQIYQTTDSKAPNYADPTLNWAQDLSDNQWIQSQSASAPGFMTPFNYNYTVNTYNPMVQAQQAAAAKTATPTAQPVAPVAPTPTPLQYTTVTDYTPNGTAYTKQYQTTDPTQSGYLSPSDLAYTQKIAAQDLANYQTSQKQNATNQQAVAAAQSAPSVSSVAPQQNITPVAPTAAPIQYTTVTDYTSTGTPFTKQYQTTDPTQSGYLSPTDLAYTQKVAAQDLANYQSSQAQNTANQQAVTAQQAQAQQSQIQSNFNQLNSIAQSTPGAPSAVLSSSNLPPVTASSTPIVAADNNITYYPSNGKWVQNSNPSASNYSSSINMTQPSITSSSQPYTAPDGTVYYPLQKTTDNATQQWVQQSNPNASNYAPNASAAYNVNNTEFVAANNSQIQYLPNPDNSGLTGVMQNGQSMVQETNPNAPGYVSPTDYFNGVSASQAAAAAASSGGGGVLGALSRGDIGGAINAVTTGVNNAASSVGSFVDNHIPGGWATVGAAALIAVGVTNPQLLGLADSGSLTPEAITDAGLNPATVSTDIANGVTTGTVAPTDVGLSTAPTVGADGSVTTTAASGATTTTSATGEVATTAADGTTTASTASGTTTAVAPTDTTAALQTNQVGALTTPTEAVAPSTTVPTTLPDGSVGSYDLTNGTVYNADGTVNTEATNAAPTPGEGVQVASNTNTLPASATGGTTTPVATATPTGSVAPSTLSSMGNGALIGAGTNAAIDLVTGKPITAQGLLTGAATGGLAAGIGTMLPEAGSSFGQAAFNGATTAVGSNAIVDLATGQPITGKNLAEQAIVGGVVGAGATAYNNAVTGTTTYAYDDGSQITTNNVTGNPVAVTDSSGASIALGTANPQTGQVTPNTSNANTPATPISPPNTVPTTTTTETPTEPVTPPTPVVNVPNVTVDPTNGTQTTTNPDGTQITEPMPVQPVNSVTATDNTNTSTLNVNPTGPAPTSTTAAPTTPVQPTPTTTTTAPATVDNGNGTSTQTYEDGSTLTTNNTTGDPISTTDATTPVDTTTDLTNNPNTISSAASAAAAASAANAATSNTPAPATGNQFLPIPTFTGLSLTNPGVNPGFIQPTPQYGVQAPGVDTYYWGNQPYAQSMSQLGQTNPNAPVTPYGQASQLGQLISPSALNYPSLQSLAAAQGTNNPQLGDFSGLANMGYDIYHNPVQMNTATPSIAGVPQTFGYPTPTQSMGGTSPSVLVGQNLNYVTLPSQLQATPSQGMATPGTFTAISPEDLAAQLQAQATAAGLASAKT